MGEAWLPAAGSTLRWMIDDLITIAHFDHRDEAEIARARLAADGIDSVVQADDEGGLSPGFFTVFDVRLVVRRDRADDARRALGIEAGS